MKRNQLTRMLLAMGIALVPGAMCAQDHSHLNAGAADPTQDAKLTFDNGPDFAASGGYIKTLILTNAGAYAGRYQGNITLTALAQTPLNGGPAPHAPALGSLIQARLVSLTGPAGGALGFWEAGATNATFSLECGQTGTQGWRLSESDGSPGADPYGHIHGRRFTLNQPGIYQAGLQLFDVSTNGLHGGPIHTPSEVLSIYFQAGVNLHSLEPDGDHTHVRFSAPAGNTWQLMVSDSLDPESHWIKVGAPVTGDDYIHEVEEDRPVEGHRYYRIQAATP